MKIFFAPTRSANGGGGVVALKEAGTDGISSIVELPSLVPKAVS